MKNQNLPIAKIGDYKKMLLAVHKTYHKEQYKQNHRKAAVKEFVRWLFGN